MDIRNSNGIYILRRRGPDRRRHVPDNRTSPSESGGLSLARAAHQSGRRIYRLSFAPTPELLVHRDVVNITISMNYVYIKQVYTYTRQKVQYGKLKSVLIGHLLSHVLLLLNDLVQLFFVFEVLSPIADGTMAAVCPRTQEAAVWTTPWKTPFSWWGSRCGCGSSDSTGSGVRVQNRMRSRNSSYHIWWGWKTWLCLRGFLFVVGGGGGLHLHGYSRFVIYICR